MLTALARSLLYFIGSFFSSVFGTFQWRAPWWVASLAAFISRKWLHYLNQCNQLRRDHPRSFYRRAGALCILLAALGGGSYWYVTLPEPHKISWTIIDPQPTPLTNDATPFPLRVVFSGSAASLHLVDKVIAKGIDVSPPLKGSWKWKNDSELTFMPEGDWEIGTEYRVKLARSLFASSVHLESYGFSFRAPPFQPSITNAEFYEDPTNPKIKQVVTTVQFTHPVDKSDFEKRVSVKMRVNPVKSFTDSRASPLGFQVVYSEKGDTAFIRSSNIEIPSDDGEVLVTVQPGTRAARGGVSSPTEASRTTTIPGIENYFRITSLEASFATDSTSFETNRVLTVESSAAVSARELQKSTEVFLLPERHAEYDRIKALGLSPQEESEEGDEDSPPTSINCPLESASQVTDELLESATRIELRWLPTERDFENLNSATFQAPEHRCLYARVKRGTKSFGDFELTRDRATLLASAPFPPEVQILHKGSLLSLGGDQKLSIMGRNVPSVRAQVWRVLPSALHHVASQTEAWSPLTNPTFVYTFGPENIAELFTSILTLPDARPGAPRYTTLDFKEFLAPSTQLPRGLFFIEVAGWDTQRNIQQGESVKRLILISDLGFIVKTSLSGEDNVFVTSFSRRAPVEGATVQVLGRNGLPVFSGVTDSAGRVGVPSLKELRNEKEPLLYVIQAGDDLSFMPLSRNDRVVNLSRFDVGGLFSDSRAESLQAYLFSDRGIYRPGEESRLGMIIRDKSWAPLPEGLPLELSVTDPRGSEILKQAIKIPGDGFSEFILPISESALTGTYTASLSLVRKKYQAALLGSTPLRVEEFMPDRLKISTSIVSKEGVSTPYSEGGWISPSELSVVGNLKNLFGTPAVGNTLRATLSLTPSLPPFKGFEGFTFTDPLKTQSSFEETIGDKLTDDSGEAVFPLNLERFERGVYRLTARVEGFEKEGGRSVLSVLQTVVSPLPYLVGTKANGDLTFVRKEHRATVECVAVGPSLERVAAENLTLVTEESRFISVLTKLENGNLAYQSVEKKIPVSTKRIDIPKEGFSIPVPSEKPGSFRFILLDANGTELARVPFTVIGDADVSTNLERNAELKVKLNKKDYTPGETIEVHIQAPYTGSGVITIERDRIFTHQWFTANTTSSIQRIVLPEHVDGNAYVSVTFIRALDSSEIYMSPLSYGVEPFSVSKARRTQAITLTTPPSVKPGDSLLIDVSAPAKTRAVVYAVDEGILQVARYRTPDPLSHFFRKRALEVKTSQIVDLLLPEYSVIQSLSAPGGDDDALLGRHKNPFKRKGQKPVAFWSGIREIGPEPTRVSFPIPDYFNGNVKIFAVSASAQRIGVQEQSALSQGDIVISPHAPLALSPGDEVDMTAVITNLKSPSSSITASLNVDSRLEVLGDATRILDIAPGKDGVASFRVRARDALGSASVVFGASSGSASSRYSLDTSIRPSSPLITTTKSGSVVAGLLTKGSVAIPLTRSLYSEEREQKISVSSSPFVLSRGVSQYLSRYPHGCTEQVTSAAFPTLIFSAYPELGLNRMEAEQSLRKAFGAMASRQNDDGSFKMWAGPGAGSNTWLDVHVARFLIEARERGFMVPEALYTRTVNRLYQIAMQTPETLHEARSVAHAIYLLTRAKVVTRSYLESLIETLRNSSWGWKEDSTALFIGASFKLLRMDTDAEVYRKGVAPLLPELSDSGWYFADPLFHAGSVLSLTARHFPEMLPSVSGKIVDFISQQLALSLYSTLSASAALEGLDQYHRALAGTFEDAVSVHVGTDAHTLSPLSLTSGVLRSAPLPPQTKLVEVTNSGKNSLFYSIAESGFEKGIVQTRTQGIEVVKELLTSSNTPLTQVKIGDDITVRILVRSSASGIQTGPLALVDLFPAGFELIGGSESASNEGISKEVLPFVPDYRDAREDRIMLYGYVSGDVVEYRYRLKAASRGVFVVPPAYAEMMYSPGVSGNTGQASIEIQ